MERRHAKLGGSSAERWMNCPGSVALSAGIAEEPPGEHASRGTAAHELLETSLTLGCAPEEFRGDTIEADGMSFVVDDDLIIPVTVAYRYITKRLAETGGTLQLEVWVHDPDLPDCGGYGDVFIVDESANKLITIDYKNGFKNVSAVENKQLMFYGLLYDTEVPFDEYEFVIVQPNSPGEPIESWSASQTTMAEFFNSVGWGASRVRRAEETPTDQLLDQNLLTIGPHCDYCKAKLKCPAMSAGFDEFDKDVDAGAEELSPERMGVILYRRKAMEKFFDAVADRANQLNQKGVKVPGTKLVRKFGNRSYTMSDDELLKRLRNAGYGKKLVTVQKVLTPKQLEAAIDDPELVDRLTTREYKGLETVLESARGEAVDPAAEASAAFATVDE